MDELAIYLAPVVVGGGNRLLPVGLQLKLSPVEELRSASGMVFFRYAARNDGSPV